MQDKENTDHYEIKYAVPSYYEIYKSGGSTLKDDKRGITLRICLPVDWNSRRSVVEERMTHMEKYKILMEMNRKLVFGEEI